MVTVRKSIRQICLDTETTGLYPDQGDRIIEIACVELVDRKFTGNTFHQYLNPGCSINSGALAVHGITEQFLQDKPKFLEVVDPFLEFVRDSEVIIHNAPFDVGFINMELNRMASRFKKIEELCVVIDTLQMARTKHPGQRNSLDVLCKRYKVDNSEREWHGALLDVRLLAQVYLAMTGGQVSMSMETWMERDDGKKVSQTKHSIPMDLKIQKANEEETQEHLNYMNFLKASSEKRG